jgi:hypothetical protein
LRQLAISKHSRRTKIHEFSCANGNQQAFGGIIDNTSFLHDGRQDLTDGNADTIKKRAGLQASSLFSTEEKV